MDFRICSSRENCTDCIGENDNYIGENDNQLAIFWCSVIMKSGVFSEKQDGYRRRDMTIQECYAELNGDFDDMLERLESEELIEMLALAFLEDDSFQTLEKGMQEEDYNNAFLGAHTLKGVVANLGFTELFQVSDELTEELRGGRKPQNDTLYEKVKAEYNRTIAVLKELQQA